MGSLCDFFSFSLSGFIRNICFMLPTTSEKKISQRWKFLILLKHCPSHESHKHHEQHKKKIQWAHGKGSRIAYSHGVLNGYLSGAQIPWMGLEQLHTGRAISWSQTTLHTLQPCEPPVSFALACTPWKTSSKLIGRNVALLPLKLKNFPLAAEILSAVLKKESQMGSEIWLALQLGPFCKDSLPF